MNNFRCCSERLVDEDLSSLPDGFSTDKGESTFSLDNDDAAMTYTLKQNHVEDFSSSMNCKLTRIII